MKITAASGRSRPEFGNASGPERSGPAATGNRLRACRPGGFTLIELLAAITVVLILASLLFLGIEPIRANALRSKCATNLRQLALAGLLYAEDHRGMFPVPKEQGQLPVSPWDVARLPRPNENPANIPLYPYLQNADQAVRCPADTARYPARAGAPAWASTPFYKTTGTSYYYNSYPGSGSAVANGTQRGGLYGLGLNDIQNPSRMVFFADQDARVIIYSNNPAVWGPMALYWHSKPGTQLAANIAFVDGSVRFVDIVSSDKAEYTFYNE